MNIFCLDRNPTLAAQYHSDVHLRKMILESAQLCSTAHHLLPNPRVKLPEFGLYKKTHANHPSAIWVRESIMNYHWVSKLGVELCKEFEYRFGKKHATERLLKWLDKYAPNIDYVFYTKMPLVMPEECKVTTGIIKRGQLIGHVLKDAVKSYRKYYRMEKLYLAKKHAAYTKRGHPDWWPEFTQTQTV